MLKEMEGVKWEGIEEVRMRVGEEFGRKMIDMVRGGKGEMVWMESEGEGVKIEFEMG